MGQIAMVGKDFLSAVLVLELVLLAIAQERKEEL
jgi:hypothetical protein